MTRAQGNSRNLRGSTFGAGGAAAADAGQKSSRLQHRGGCLLCCHALCVPRNHCLRVQHSQPGPHSPLCARCAGYPLVRCRPSLFLSVGPCTFYPWALPLFILGPALLHPRALTARYVAGHPSIFCLLFLHPPSALSQFMGYHSFIGYRFAFNGNGNGLCRLPLLDLLPALVHLQATTL